jgi:23S rRNA pseudouridine2605 synthase
MTDELKHPADGPEQEISSDPAGFAADAAEETKQAIADARESTGPEATTNPDDENSEGEEPNEAEDARESESKVETPLAEGPFAKREAPEGQFAKRAAPAPKLERLQKILAQAGVASRRHAEELITGGRVQINGQTVTVLGTKADPARDHIRVDGKLLHGAERLRYFVLNKPKGYVTTVTDPEGRPTVMEFFAKTGERLYPVGRLDYLSEGLLLVTNDGELANKLTKASSGVEKTYLVKVSGQPGEDMIERLRQGVVIERGKLGEGKVHTAPARIEQVRAGDNPWYEVVLIEGRNRELRKMFSEIGHHVEKIRRVGYGPLVLDLEPGKLRELDPEEVTALWRAAEGKWKPRRLKTSQMLPKEAGQSAEVRAAKAAIRAGKGFKPRNDRGGKSGFKPREHGAGATPTPWKPDFRKPGREDSRGLGETWDKDSGAKPAFGARPGYGEKAGDRPGFARRDNRGPGAKPNGTKPGFEGRGGRGPGERSSGFGARPGAKPPFRGRGPERDAPRSLDRGASAHRPFRGDRDVRPAVRSGGAPRKPFPPRDDRPTGGSEERRPRLEIRPVEFGEGSGKPAGRPPRREGSSPAFRGAGKPGTGGSGRSGFGGWRAQPGFSKPAFGSKPKPGFGSRTKPAFGSKPETDFGARAKPDFGSKPRSAFASKPKPAFDSKSKPAFDAKPKPFASQSRTGGPRPNAGFGGPAKNRSVSRPSGSRPAGSRSGGPRSGESRPGSPSGRPRPSGKKSGGKRPGRPKGKRRS